MGARSLLAGVTAAVCVAHAALLVGLARPASAPVVAQARAVSARWIVLAAPRQEAGPAAPEAPAPAARALAASRDATRAHAAEGASDAPAPMAPMGPMVPMRPATPDTPPAESAAAIGVYLAATALDVPVRPRSAPDITQLAGLSWSGVPLRLRLFIDAEGTVVDACILQSAESGDVDERVRRMFLATGFTAGIQGGRAVPSYKDIELTTGTPS